MSQVKTQAVILRSVSYGDDDLMVTLYTRSNGRVGVAAKSARKSRKRFGTSLDLFTELSVMFGHGRNRKGMPVLSEAAALRQFPSVRADIRLAAFAGAWTEVLLNATAEGEKSEETYDLYVAALDLLDRREFSPELVSAWFFMRFLSLSGLGPGIGECVQCRKELPPEARGKVAFRFASGGILCKDCAAARADIRYVNIDVLRVLFLLNTRGTPPDCVPGEAEGLFPDACELLHGFCSHHLGMRIKSLEFLRKLTPCSAKEEGPCRTA